MMCHKPAWQGSAPALTYFSLKLSTVCSLFKCFHCNNHNCAFININDVLCFVMCVCVVNNLNIFSHKCYIGQNWFWKTGFETCHSKIYFLWTTKAVSLFSLERIVVQKFFSRVWYLSNGIDIFWRKWSHCQKDVTIIL